MLKLILSVGFLTPLFVSAIILEPSSSEQTSKLPTPTLNLLSLELNIPQTTLSSHLKRLSLYILNDELPLEVCNYLDRKKTENKSFCILIKKLGFKKKPQDRKDYTLNSKVELRPSDMPLLQKQSLRKLERLIRRKKEEKLVEIAGHALKSQTCPRNLSLGLLRNLEFKLPDTKIKLLMEKLYAHVSPCLNPSNEEYEKTHLRQSLLRILWKNNNLANESIKKALLTKNPEEESRILYWAGKLAKDKYKRNNYWNKLIREHPLSLHALEVWRKSNIDPYELIRIKADLSLQRHYYGKHYDINRYIRWLEGLHLKKHYQAKDELADYLLEKYTPHLSSENILYIMSLKAGSFKRLNRHSFLKQSAFENPKILNKQILEIIFPKRYYSSFHRFANGLDPYLLMAVAKQESNFNAKAVSPAKAIGIMQLLRATAREVSKAKSINLYNPNVNIKLGSRYLKKQIKRFGGVTHALAAYNAGPSRLKRWKERFPTKNKTLFIDLIPFDETRYYVGYILRNNYWYRRLYGEKTPLESALSSTTIARLIKDHKQNHTVLAKDEEKDPQNTSTPSHKL